MANNFDVEMINKTWKVASYLCYMHVGNATGCHAGRQEVGRCCTRSESEEFITHRRENTQASKGSTLAPQKGLVSSPLPKRKKLKRLEKWIEFYITMY